MSTLLEKLSLESKKLALQERAQLAQELPLSLEHDGDLNIQAAWETEIASRIARYERGEAKLIPAAEVFETARRLTL